MEIELVISLLKTLNYTESEARTYIALLKHGSSSGYEISKKSEVPRSKIYNILESLITKGAVVCSKYTNPALYHAVPIEEVVKNIKREVNRTLDEVETELCSFKKRLDLGYIWNIREYENVFDKCRNLLQQTKEELCLQIWKEDFDEIAGNLIQLEQKGIRMLVVLYSLDHNYDIPLKHYYKHGFEEEKIKDFGGRWITLVSDSREVVFGQIQNKKNAEVVWTESAPLVFMAKEYVKHDAYFYRALNVSRPTMESVFGDDLVKIRDIFGK